ncbi:MAG: ATP-binding cassette domain-containing protein, partial [Candidatus Acidiferrales bacterium]
MIEVKDLTKSYGQITAVDHISFGVNKGEILGFLGPNGAGKT